MTKSRNAAFSEESAEVEVLFAEAAKFDNISKRIKVSLERLEGGAQIVKDSVGPVYNNTQGLQNMNTSKRARPHKKAKSLILWVDIDAILAAIDKMLVPSEDKGREERTIRAG